MYYRKRVLTEVDSRFAANLEIYGIQSFIRFRAFPCCLRVDVSVSSHKALDATTADQLEDLTQCKFSSLAFLLIANQLRASFHV